MGLARPLSRVRPLHAGKGKSGRENIDDTNEAIALLEAAVARDPSCAGAYAQLARAYNTRSFKFTSQAEGKRFRENADVALAKALDLNPNLPETQFARGLILWTKAKGFPHEQAIRSFKKFSSLTPMTTKRITNYRWCIRTSVCWRRRRAT